MSERLCPIKPLILTLFLAFLIIPDQKAEARSRDDWGPPPYYVCARKSPYRSVRPWAFERLQKLFFRPTTLDCHALMRALGPDEELQKSAGIPELSMEELKEHLSAVDVFRGTREDRYEILQNLVSINTPIGLWRLLAEKVVELKIDFTDFDLENHLSPEALQSFIGRLVTEMSVEVIDAYYSKNMFRHSQLAKTIVIQSIHPGIWSENAEKIATAFNAWAEISALPLEKRIQIFTDYLNRLYHSEQPSARRMDDTLTKDSAQRIYQLISDWEAFTSGKILESVDQENNPFHFLHYLQFDPNRKMAPELPKRFGQVSLMIERLMGFIEYNRDHFDEAAHAQWIETLFFAWTELMGVPSLKYIPASFSATAQDRMGNNILHYYFKNMSYRVASTNRCSVDSNQADRSNILKWIDSLETDINAVHSRNKFGYRPVDYISIDSCSLGKTARSFVLYHLRKTNNGDSIFSARIRGRTFEELIIEAEQSRGSRRIPLLDSYIENWVGRMDALEALQQIQESEYFLSKFIKFSDQTSALFDFSKLTHTANIQLNGQSQAIELNRLSREEFEFVRIARDGFKKSDEDSLLNLVVNRLSADAAQSRSVSEAKKKDFREGVFAASKDSIYESKSALFTQMAQVSGQNEVLYNIESTQPLLAYLDGRVQCYSGTFLMNLIFVAKGLLQSNDKEAVVIFTEGHVQPGIIQRVPKKGFRLSAIEMTTHGKGRVDYGFTHQIDTPIRVVTLKDFFIDYFLSHAFANPEAVAQEMVEQTHHKYNIPLIQFAESNAGRDGVPLGSSQSSFAFGVPKTPPGDRVMHETDTVAAFSESSSTTDSEAEAKAKAEAEAAELKKSSARVEGFAATPEMLEESNDGTQQTKLCPEGLYKFIPILIWLDEIASKKIELPVRTIGFSSNGFFHVAVHLTHFDSTIWIESKEHYVEPKRTGEYSDNLLEAVGKAYQAAFSELGFQANSVVRCEYVVEPHMWLGAVPEIQCQMPEVLIQEFGAYNDGIRECSE